MQFSGIYAITDDKLLPGQRLFSAAEAALSSGISLLQYRSKTASKARRLECARNLLSLCAQFEVPLIINDDVDLCESAGAGGVHLGRQDASIESARNRLGPEAIIGVTCHSSIEAALVAERSGADYVAFGRFFPSFSKPEASAANLQTLIQARQALTIPIVAIGGINAENGHSVLQAGADMLAVIHAIFAEDDVSAQSRKLLNMVAQYKLLNN
jgi:thiamine-phosphate pyrophosphorylase